MISFSGGVTIGYVNKQLRNMNAVITVDASCSFGMLTSTFCAMPSGDPRYEKYAAIGIAMRNSAAPEILRILVIPALPSVEGFSAVYVRRREKYHVEGQEGEVVAEREGGDSHRREKRGKRTGSQNGGIDVGAVGRVAVDEENDEGKEEGEDAEGRDEHERPGWERMRKRT